TKAAFQPHAMFVEHGAQLLFEPGRFFHDRLISTKDFSALPGLGIRLPHHRRESRQVNARNLDRIHPIVGAVSFADFARPVTIQDHYLAAKALPLASKTSTSCSPVCRATHFSS